ncbi:recombinase family protein [Actinoplanes sp. NBRC 103695]|uniref:recombinase family protein n=1 Tax=Actinoplanes sp. NBRC 103695 TaxID=3032202 RepID=UPI0024A55744|nr:recombinase family protein [Actinoplanes sp. NBRC 103695]GLY98855.1 hypothetical protein Acsp02_61090 [Actinoplanes sp. NBRC 103695]
MSARLAPVRAAFYGYTADDTDPAMAAHVLAQQYQQCVSVLPDGAVTAVFYDVGARPHCWHTPATLNLGGRHADRAGGLQALLTETSRQDRRFDFVISTALDRLPRQADAVTAILRTLAIAGVELLLASEPRADDGPLPTPLRLYSVVYLDVLAGLVTEGDCR